MDHLFVRLVVLIELVAALSTRASSPLQDRADAFLNLVNAGFQGLVRVEQEAEWQALTDVTPAHDAALETASKARAAFTGNPAIIREAREMLKSRDQLTDLSVRQLECVLRNAAEAPMTNPKLVADRIAAETEQPSRPSSHRKSSRPQLPPNGFEKGKTEGEAAFRLFPVARVPSRRRGSSCLMSL